MPFYASVEQIMRDRSELARKGIARGRSVAVLSYADGVVFIAENASTALRKVSEIYDRIGFAAVGRYSEYDNLRTAGIRLADMRGYSYDRRDVSGRQLANSYAHALNSIFTEQQKPYEVEVCVAEVGKEVGADQLYRITYDGSMVDERDFVIMGGQAEAMTLTLREIYRPGLPLAEAVELGVRALASVGGSAGAPRDLPADQLEVAILDRFRPQRAFKRITAAALAELLPGPVAPDVPAGESAPDTPETPETPETTQTTDGAPEVDAPGVIAPPPPPDPHPGQPPAMPRPDGAGGEADDAAAGPAESGPASPGSA